MPPTGFAPKPQKSAEFWSRRNSFGAKATFGAKPFEGALHF